MLIIAEAKIPSFANEADSPIQKLLSLDLDKLNHHFYPTLQIHSVFWYQTVGFHKMFHVALEDDFSDEVIYLSFAYPKARKLYNQYIIGKNKRIVPYARLHLTNYYVTAHPKVPHGKIIVINHCRILKPLPPTPKSP
jgi:hypothetical protein